MYIYLFALGGSHYLSHASQSYHGQNSHIDGTDTRAESTGVPFKNNF